MPKRWLSLALGAIGATALLAMLAAAACSSSVDVSKTVPKNASAIPTDVVTKVPKSVGGVEGGPDEVMPGPASKYSPSLSELPGSYTVNVPSTFTDNISTFASSYLFKSAQQGQDLAVEWGILDGFKAAYDPDGLEAGVLLGRYYINVETYYFEKTSGAHAAFQYMDSFFAGVAGSEKQVAKGLGNESGGYKIIQGTVGTSSEPKAYYRFIFRRGNVIGVTQVTGADKYISVDNARDVAVIMDDRMLGTRQATEPTPIPTPKILIPPTPVPTGAGGN